MLNKSIFRFFVLSSILFVSMTTFTFATASASGGGGGGTNVGSSSSGGGGGMNVGSRASGGGRSYDGFAYSNDVEKFTDEEYEDAGYEVVSRSDKYVLLRGISVGNYSVDRIGGGSYGHQYLKWYVENVWDNSEPFDYDKFLRYVDKYQNNLDRAFGSYLDFDGSAEDLESGNFEDADDYDDYYDNNDEEFGFNQHRKSKGAHNNIGSINGGPGVVNSFGLNGNSLFNNTSSLSEYGKILTSSGSQWIKNQDGTYSLFYVEASDNRPTIASNGFYTIIDSTNNSNINTYYFDNNGIMVTTPIVDSNGKTIYFTATGEVIR